MNEQQRDAARHRDGPLLIIAGAGTGKTTTLAHRVACLIARGVDPARILLLTFTRRAAAEMLRRVDGILHGAEGAAGASARRAWGGTFHAVAARLLRQHGKLIGLPPEFTILDRSDSEDLLNVLRSELELGGDPKKPAGAGGDRFPLKGTCLDIYSRVVNTRHALDDVLKRDFPWCAEHGEGLKALFHRYTDRKEAQGILDYDDLLVFWHALLAEPATGDVVRAKFDCVLIDEYQDTNALQAEIVRGLRPDGTGLTAVGDDAQSIYSFRAATVRNILDFPRQFPGTTVVTLEQNYRSTQPILDATNAVIAEAAERYQKNLWSARASGERPALVTCLDEDEQTDFVVAEVLRHREAGVALKRQAVLFRASHHSLALEVELARRNIPFAKYGGLKFVEAAHIKDLLAFLRLAENPRDLVSGLRVLMLLPGVGPRKARQLMDRLQESGGDFAAWAAFQPPAAAADHWPLLTALMRILAKRAAGAPVTAEVHQVRTFYAPLLQQKYDRPQPRLRDLEQLEHLAGRFPDRATFLAEVTLDPPSSTQDLAGDPLLDEDWLVLSTIHSAKGLEWDCVYVLHAADGNIPSDMATRSTEEIDEERRLFYVALTRARRHLYVCHPQRYYFAGRRRGDGHSLNQLTRFLSPSVLTRFRSISAAPAIEANEPTDGRGGFSTSDVRRRIRGMWS